jgi:hypothetical protein
VARASNSFDASIGGGFDLILAYKQLKQIAGLSSRDARRAIQRAKDAAGYSVSDGHTSYELGCFLPKFEESGEEAIRFWGGGYRY